MFSSSVGGGPTNQNPGLTSFMTLWHLHHNRLANELASLYPYWNDERIFQEARRILNAQFQHFVYNEVSCCRFELIS